jgi:hypothetical protein
VIAVEGIMSKFNIGMKIAVVVLATALSATAYAAPPKGGGSHGGGGGSHGGGGAPHGGGGAAHAGGGAPHGGGGAPHGGGGAHFSGGGSRGVSHASAGRAISHATARPSARGNAGGNAGRASNRAAPSGSRAVGAPNNANRSNANRTVRSGGVNASRSTTRTTNRNANVRTTAVRNALNSRSNTKDLHNASALRNTHARNLITAHAATAGWEHGRNGGHGWWQHQHGGYGWVGPVFWPFAYYDMYDYALWGDGYDDSFWDYGYNDIYAGLFSPYGYDDLAGYLPQQANTNTDQSSPASPSPATVASGPLAPMCGQDNSDIAGLPIDQVRQAIQPNAAQSAALDDLAAASLKAAQGIQAGCPTDIALTAPSRLAAMQTRVESMIAAVATVQPALEKFYGLLSDDQKAQLTALGEDQRQSKTAATGGTTCGAAPAGVGDWPTADIEQTVRPTDAQRPSLVALQAATAKAAGMLNASCPTSNPLTPTARLAAAGQRLDTILQAVKTVRVALNDFYGQLNDEQKARFDAIGPDRTSQADQPKAPQAEYRRRNIGNIGNVIRSLIQNF